MSTVIIYKQDNGKIAVVIPTQDAIKKEGIEAIALKDVPTGKRFKYMNSVDLPSINQEEWEFDESSFNDGIGS